MTRLLVCGFGPFPGAPSNPAAAVVGRLRTAGWAPPGMALSYAILPTVWREAQEVAAQAALDNQAEALLLVGVATGGQAFRVEALARNRSSGAPDAKGGIGPAGPISADGADVLAVPFDVIEMASAVSASGAPVELSTDAGDYLCNHTLYRLLLDGWRTAFLHVPMAEECDAAADFSLDEIEAAVRAVVASLIGQA